MKTRYAFFLAVFLLASALLFAQSSGRITGTVVDASGAPIPNAAVSLHLAGGKSAVFSTTTSSDGIFTFASVRPGLYDLVVETAGFAKYISRQLNVEPVHETPIPTIKMEVQSTQQTVEVASETQLVQTNNAEISTTVTQSQIQNLPVLDRQVSTLFLTQPGVTGGGEASMNNTVVNGMRTSMASVTLDGINIQDNFIRTNSLDYIPTKTTIEQVQQMTITTSNSSSALGVGSAQIVLVTPSGGNAYHGSLYWYNRNNKFAANDWFNNRDGVDLPFLNQNQIGGSLGGRIIRDKLFFYTNYEAFRNRQQSRTVNTVLLPAARNGVFTYQNRSGATVTADLLKLRGVSIDPVIASLLQQVPTTVNDLNDTGDKLNTGGYSFNAQANEDRDVILVKGDYILSEKHSFTATYERNTDKLNRPDIGNFYTVTPPISNDNHTQLLSLAWRWNIRPTLTNEVRGGFALSPGIFADSQKYPPYFVGSTIFTSPVNTFQAQGRATNTYHIQDNANWVKGKHTIQFGFQQQFIRTAPYNDAGITPTYDVGLSASNTTGFTVTDLPGISSGDLATANSLYATLAGIVTDNSQTFNITSRTSGFVNGATNLRHLSFDTYAGYVQDNYKVLPRLTLNLGLRYEYYTPLNERDSLFLLPQLINNNYIQTLLSNFTLNFAGNSAGRPLYNSDKNNFGPNIGFAYDLFGNGKTAVRGGYSVFFVNDDTITSVYNNAGTTNSGTTASVTNTGLVGKLTGNLPAIQTPVFKVPLQLSDNYALSTSTAGALPDPNLRTPYVQQYNFGIQHEIKNTIVSVSYVGNHGTKLLRAFDYNQVIIKQNGFLADFLRAENNGFLALAAGRAFDPRYNASITGSQPLTVFPQLASGGLLTNSTVINDIRTGQPGTLAQVYQTNGLNGNVNFFANPYGLGMNTITNGSNSTYNSFQLDIRSRSRTDFQWQFNYVFSKVLSDEGGVGQTRFEPYLDINNPSIERAPAPFDIRQQFKGNYYYELPFGKGKRFSTGKTLNYVVGGWATSGLLTYESGNPFSIISGRGTLNRGARSTNTNTADATVGGSALSNIVGFYMTGDGPTEINPSAVGTDGRGVASDGSPFFNGQVFYNPPAGTVGQLQRRSFYGPWFFDWDFSMEKKFAITEASYVQLRAEAFNGTNHPSFQAGDANGNLYINNTTFAAITGTQSVPRVLQLGLYFRF